MKNGMLDSMAKTRALNEKRQVKEFLGKLKKWNDINLLKDKALKTMVKSVLSSGDEERRWGLWNLRLFNHAEKAFKRCHTLYRLMDISTLQHHKQKALHYMMMF